MSAVKKSIKPLTVKQLVLLLKNMAPTEIPKIPLEALPSNIPANITEKLPPASQSAVEDLLMNLNSFHLKSRVTFAENYGDDVLNAMDKAKQSCVSNTLRVFKNKILTFISTLQESKNNNNSLPEEVIVSQIKAINGLMIDVHAESKSMSDTLSTLVAVKPVSTNDKERFDNLISKIKKSLNVTENTIAEYYVLRLKLLADVINEKKKFIESNEEAQNKSREELDMLRAELDDTKGFWKRTVKRKVTLQEEDQIQNRIEQLINEINQNESIISENDLILWLDTIVDASLNERSNNRVSKSLRTARISLYYLLNRFCQNQEQSAIQIAQNPFIQVDPEQAIRYVLLSEQFILDYFAKKKNEKTAWLSGAAEDKISKLDDLQKAILQELKKASRGIL